MPMLKKVVLKVFPTIIFLSIFCGIGYFLIISPPSKPSATVEQVWEVLVSQGYQPLDTTKIHLEKYPKSDRFESIGVEKDDVRFEFFTFENDNNAVSLYEKFYSLVFSTRNTPYAQRHTHISNYDIYALASSGRYSVAIRVGSTVLYAYCNAENEVKMNTILSAIDYLD